MNERTRIVGHQALADRMGWTSRAVATSIFGRAEVRRRAGNPLPGDLPAADGYQKDGSHQRPWWYEDTIAAWAASRPSAVRAARNRPDGTKTCVKCEETKPLSEFSSYVDKRRGPEPRLQAKCKTCRMKNALDWNGRNPDRANAANRKWKKKTERYYKARRYGLTEIELAAMEAAQQGICLICGEFAENGLFIDHCHATGVVRGLLCGQCNLGLGAFRDNPKRLLRAIWYLKTRCNGVFAEPDRDGVGRVA